MSLLYQPADGDDREDLLDRYREGLVEVLRAVDRERVLAESDLEEADVDAIAEGGIDAVRDLTVEEAASLRALAGEDAESLLGAVRDELLLAMTGAVMDVERLAANVEADLTPKEIQAKVEGRHPMTLEEYAALRVALAE